MEILYVAKLRIVKGINRPYIYKVTRTLLYIEKRPVLTTGKQ